MAVNFQNPLFIDIETVGAPRDFEQLTSRMQALWMRKARTLGAENEEEARVLFRERGGIYAEFGKIIVIGLGYLGRDENGEEVFRLRTLADDDEKALLQAFCDCLKGFPRNTHFCGHNIKEFDIPYLCRRLVIANLPLPPALDLAGKKPWEVQHIDTMELWKFGDRKSYTPLDLLGAILDVPSSKSDIDGSQVSNCYYEEKGGLERIARYCGRDVIATAQVYRRMKGLPLMQAKQMPLL